MTNLRHTLANANALLVFESAARLESFTRAAEELGVSQPAVTRQIKTVEGVVGRPLFRRDHNRLTLTADGQRLWSAVSSGFGEIADTLAALRSESRRRRVVLASHAGFAQQWLMPRFEALSALFGDIDLRLMISDSDSEMDGGDHDFAVRVGAGRWPEQHAHRLIPEIVFPVASPALLAERPDLRDAAPADLLDAPLLHMDEGDKPWLTWPGWFRAVDVGTRPPPADVVYNNYPLVLQAVLAGRGVALGWRPLVDEPVRQGVLVPVGPAVVNETLGYYLTWPDREPAAGLAPDLCAWFDARVGAERDG
jgi:DNA-binding transcriptional LysR family regulator